MATIEEILKQQEKEREKLGIVVPKPSVDITNEPITPNTPSDTGQPTEQESEQNALDRGLSWVTTEILDPVGNLMDGSNSEDALEFAQGKITKEEYDKRVEGRKSRGPGFINDKEVEDLVATTERYVSMNQKPEYMWDTIKNMTDDEAAAAHDKARVQLRQKGMEYFLRQNPNINPDAVRIDEAGNFHVRFTDGGDYLPVEFNLWGDLRNMVRGREAEAAGIFVGGGEALIAAAQSPKGKFISALARVVPGTNRAIKVGNAVNKYVKPFVASVAGATAGAGVGGTADDVYNRQYLNQEANIALSVRKGFDRALEELSWAPVGPVIGGAYGIAKGLWTAGMSNIPVPIVRALYRAVKPGAPDPMDNELTKAALIQAGLDPTDPAVQRGIADARKAYFEKKGGDPLTADEAVELEGNVASAEVTGLTQSEGLAKATSDLPSKKGMNEQQRAAAVAQERDIYNRFLGQGEQATIMAQKRLAEIRKQYPKLEDAPNAVQQEAAVLESGLPTLQTTTQVTKTLRANPDIWQKGSNDSAAETLFSQENTPRLLRYVDGLPWPFQKGGLLRSGLSPERFSDVYGRPKVVPPSIAVAMKGKVAGKDAEVSEAFGKGIRGSKAAYDNAITYLSAMSKKLGEGLKTDTVVALDPLRFRQISQSLDENYAAALDSVQGLATDSTYRIFGSQGIQTKDLNRIKAELARASGPSADFANEVVNIISKGKTENMSAGELIYLSNYMKSWHREHVFKVDKLPITRDFLNKVAVVVDKKVVEDLSKTPEGLRALNVLNGFRDNKRAFNEVRTNRIFKKIEAFIKDAPGGKLTEEQYVEMNKILESESLAADHRSMSLLLNKLPKPQAEGLADYLMQRSYERNLSADGKIIDVKAMAHELSGLRGTSSEYIKERLAFIDDFNDWFGGAMRASQVPYEKGDNEIIEKIKRAGSTAGMARTVGGKLHFASINLLWSLTKDKALEVFGITPKGITGLRRATTEFFEQPLNLKSSNAMEARIKAMREKAQKSGEQSYLQKIDEFEANLREIQAAEYTRNQGG